MRHPRLASCFCWILFTLACSTALLSQGVDTALVRVTVADPSGAMVPNASVTMTNEGTGVVVTRLTDGRGECIFTALPPAPYTAKVVAQGFKPAERGHLVLQIGQQVDVPSALQVGAHAEGD